VTARVAARLLSVSKRYGGVAALDAVSLELERGVGHALVGENGAGKSTLVKILCGATAPSAGALEILDDSGAARRFEQLTPHLAQQLGVRVVHQEFALIDALSVAENVHFGSEPRRFRIVPDRAAMRRRTRALLDLLGVPLDVDRKVATLSVGQKQVVEIAKGLGADAKIFVLDEPTAPLTPVEVERLYAVVRRLKQRGVAVLYISHRLQEVFDLCETVTVLRDGVAVHEGPVAGLTRRDLVRFMAGRDLGLADESAPPHLPGRTLGAVRLRVRGLSAKEPGRTALEGVDLDVRAGEVVGLAGLVGAGRSETLRALFGAGARSAGTIEVDGRRVAPRSPADAIAAGVGLVPEDRKSEGAILRRSVRENATLAVLGRESSFGVLRPRRLQALAEGLARRLRIKARSVEDPVGALSGGNQQKVVLARWLAARCPVLLLDEPTRGIDVAARQEIYQVLRELSRDGHALLVASSSLPELLALSDRLVVFRDGRVVGEFTAAEATPEAVLQRAAR
jgi:ribose transport system ATP-binding protein